MIHPLSPGPDRIADVLGLQHEEPSVGLRVVRDLHVSGVLGHPSRPRRAYQLRQVRTRQPRLVNFAILRTVLVLAMARFLVQHTSRGLQSFFVLFLSSPQLFFVAFSHSLSHAVLPLFSSPLLSTRMAQICWYGLVVCDPAEEDAGWR